MTKTHLLILGSPGAGKGTQAAELAERYGVPAISTGDIFRANIRNNTELGQQVKAIIDAGDYVTDDLTNEIVRSRLSEADAQAGFVLDGYPRTKEQVQYLDELLAANGEALDAVVRLVADADEVVRRLLARSKTEGRSDDTEASIKHRLEVYERETAPLVELYADRDLIVEVDGLGEISEVSRRIDAGLAAYGVHASR
ncbi:adenylate kinase [Humidisolicoccus flavus]|uniref:adenylate kinase n=1 Tax=Humidisolicoccus flavus TaxID=3111414 RepID=UPI00324AE045